MSGPRPIRIGPAVEWLLLLSLTALIAWLTLGLDPGLAKGSTPVEAGYNLRPFGNLRFLLAQVRLGKVLSPLFAYEFLSLAGNIALFWGWSFLATHAFSPRGKNGFEPVVWAVVAGLSLSAGIEALQVFLPARSADVDDVIANGAGTIVGALHAWTRRGFGVDWA